MEVTGKPYVPAALFPGTERPATHRIGDWVCPRVCPDEI